MDELTADTFLDGRLAVRQRRNGYRFSIDAVLLAGFARPRRGDRAVDLGAGCGIISLLLAVRTPGFRITAVEIQPALAELAGENAVQNRLDHRIRVVREDLRRFSADVVGGPVDLVVSNPPFRPPRSGRVNPNPERAAARHERYMGLPDLVAAGRRLLRTGGRMAVIYPADRAAELITRMSGAGIEPKVIRWVHSTSADPARRVLVEGVRAARPGVRVTAPLVIYARPGIYTGEVAQLFSEGITESGT